MRANAGQIYLYESVAAELAKGIASGALAPGARVPSVREVCRSFGVSLSTAVQALTLLETQGLVEARPQSGYYVRANLPDASRLEEALGPRGGRQTPCAYVETGDLINEVVAATRDPNLVPLGATTIASDLLPGAGVYRSMMQAARDLGPDALGYEMGPGNDDLRQQLARRAAQFGCPVKAADAIVTSGSMEAIGLCLRAVTRPGDTVACETPIFYGIVGLLGALDLRVAEVRTHPETGMDLDCLRSILRTRKVAAILTIANFSNPLGAQMPDAAKKELVQLAMKEDIPLIEDDVYGDLQHDGGRPSALKTYDKKGQVMYCSSVSKTLSPGLRVGWVFPGKWHPRVERLKFVTTIATATVPQAAVARYLERGGYDRHLRRLRAALRTQMAQYVAAVQRHFPEGTRVTQPKGGAVLWVQLPSGGDAMTLYRKAKAKGISIIPGAAFTSDLERYKDGFRLSCGHPFNRLMDDALKRLGHLAR